MELCDNDHDEICFTSKICPLCDFRDDEEYKIRELEKQVKELEESE